MESVWAVILRLDLQDLKKNRQLNELSEFYITLLSPYILEIHIDKTPNSSTPTSRYHFPQQHHILQATLKLYLNHPV